VRRVSHALDVMTEMNCRLVVRTTAAVHRYSTSSTLLLTLMLLLMLLLTLLVVRVTDSRASCAQC